MNLISIHILLSVALFFIVNWVGNHSIHAGYVRMSVLAKVDEAPAFNFVYRAFSPVAFITVTSAVLYNIGQEWVVKDIYLVTIYYFSIRLLFNLLTGRGMLLNWGVQVAHIIVSTMASYYVYDVLIIHKEFLFPTAKELGSAIWLAIAAYAYHTFNNVKTSGAGTKARKRDYLKNRYSTYRRRYGDVIGGITQSSSQEALTYAVLIYEAFNRPLLYRLIENILFFLGYAKTLGIMQVTTDIFIGDRESVRLGTSKIVSDHAHAESTGDSRKYGAWVARRAVIRLYNPDDDYVNEVSDLYEEIVHEFYADEKIDQYSQMRESVRNLEKDA